jgi:hypothetical protein
MLICIGRRSLYANLCFIFGKASNTILSLLVYHMSIFGYLFRAVITKDSEIWLEKQLFLGKKLLHHEINLAKLIEKDFHIYYFDKD